MVSQGRLNRLCSTVTLLSMMSALGTSVVGASPLQAQTRRALIVGINKYNYNSTVTDAWRARLPADVRNARAADPNRRGNLDDLAGAVNDAVATKSVLESRFLFSADNVVLLEDAQATRDGILVAVRHLIDVSNPGDVVVFYYAGHGSQRYNSLAPTSMSINKMDQTIVPADANVGQFDIRNTELTELFDQLLAKNVLLTLIFDSCNSGTAVRGITPAHARVAPFDLRDAHDASNPESVTRPGRTNAAVFLAAAHESESAIEDGKTGHGAFTAALLDVLSNPSTSINASAQQVFQQVEAAMRSNNVQQVPVLRGIAQNTQRPLFGNVTGPLAGRTTLALQGRRGDTLLLSGGAAMGIGVGSELRLVDTASSAVRVRVVAVPNLTTSHAVVISGSVASVRPPALFVLERWVLAAGAELNAWLPASIDAAELRTITASLATLRTSVVAEWVADPTMLPDDRRPLYTVERATSGWAVRTPTGSLITLAAPTANAVEAAVAGDVKSRTDSSAKEAGRLLAKHLPAPTLLGKPRLFVMMPPTRALVDSLDLERADSPIHASSRPDSSQYVLAGRIGDDNSVSYAWVLPDATRATRTRSPFPPRTNWVSMKAPNSGADSLFSLGSGLARINYWLAVKSHDAAALPYHLALRRTAPLAGPDKVLGDTLANVGGEQYQLVLRKDPHASALVLPKSVYVFIIASDGKSTLLFGESQNIIPPADANGVQSSAPAEIVLPGDPITICPTYGMDTFILLSSTTPFPAPRATFEFGAVRTDRGVRDVGRDVGRATNADWSIERLPILSIPPNNPAGLANEKQMCGS